MTELSTDWAGLHGESVLRVPGSSPLTEGTDVFRALGVYVIQGLALEAPYNGGSGWQFRSVRDNDGVVTGSRLHNHPQSSGGHNVTFGPGRDKRRLKRLVLGF